MRHLVASLLVGCLALSACDMLAPAASRKPVSTQGTIRASIRPTIVMSAPPSSRPKASPTPSGPTVLLKGKVQLDAHYLVASGAGSIIPNNGASVIALKAGTLISDNGLGLISDNGLGLISDNGLGLISDNGSGLVGKSGFRVAQAADVSVGTVLPVKGMAVLPFSMRTGELVGKPVFTDENGDYQLNVPEALAGSLRLVAKVPVAKADDPIAKDPRLAYSLVANTTTQAPVIDEDSALVTKYIRACFAYRVKEAMITDDVATTTQALLRALHIPDALISFMQGVLQDLNAAAVKAHVKDMPPEKVEALAQRVTDQLISYIDLDTLEVDPAAIQRPGEKERAVAGMTVLLKQTRTAATQKLQDAPTFFDESPYLVNARHAVGYKVRKPSDLGDFLVQEYLLSTEDRYAELEQFFMSFGLTKDHATHLNTLALGIMANVSQTLFSNSDAKQQMLKTIEDSGEP